jgi:phosphoribosylamine--glycine ligase
MKILVVGSGAREHALVKKIAASPLVREVLAAPGNAGIAADARTCDVPADDVERLVALAVAEAVDLVVVGPEAPLVLGLVDALAARGIPAFGPSAEAARLEGSKVYAKELMAACGVPTAGFRVFDRADAAAAYVRERGAPIVVKADGLAAGKGVVVAASVEEALLAIDAAMVQRVFGEAGAKVVIEDCMVGPEVSYHVLSDGERWVPLAAAQDHKRLLDGDRGPNTGGMGAYSPPPVFTAAIEREVGERVIAPTLRAMRERGAPFRGALFVGLMIVDGLPEVLEYNVRFGDPETEVLMARLSSDVVPLLLGCARGELGEASAEWGAGAAMAVVIAAAGYPGTPRKGDPIGGLEEAARHAQVLHAGTRRSEAGVVSNGGRVLAVTATGDDGEAAARRAYAAADAIQLPGAQLRRDIGWQARPRP